MNKRQIHDKVEKKRERLRIGSVWHELQKSCGYLACPLLAAEPNGSTFRMATGSNETLRQGLLSHCSETLTPDAESDNIITLTKQEAEFLIASWNIAINTCDVGGELIVRLLNDKRSLFKSLLESQVGILDEEKFTVDMINCHYPRAKQVGDGVVRFFNKALDTLNDYNPCPKLRQMSSDLGARHYRMRVWFQAENWLCVKNSLLEVVLELENKAPPSGFGLISKCVGSNAVGTAFQDKMTQRMIWTKLVQFVIRNMKRGFLEEALKTDRNSDSEQSQSSVSYVSDT